MSTSKLVSCFIASIVGISSGSYIATEITVSVLDIANTFFSLQKSSGISFVTSFEA